LPITVHIPGPLRAFTDGRSEVALPAPAATLREALDALGSLYPGIRDRVLTEQGAVREHVNIFVGNEDIRYTGGLGTRLDSGAVISIVPAISGGCGTAGGAKIVRTARLRACLPKGNRRGPPSSQCIDRRAAED
jgi:molybdopterin converting factor small subunit